MRLRDRVAVITGGGGDIGTASAFAMAREGALVAVTDNRPDMAARTAEKIVAAGGRAKPYRLDVLGGRCLFAPGARPPQLDAAHRGAGPAHPV